ncbi:MAG: ABC transporter permease [Firmicutes bacterium]|jgi:ABC-2 type transport system permease protein|nr:ABC transporter permease [Bacillota bacterium]MCL5065016.1 ABC transporter permease [Bacillota bacterium]
MSPTGRELHALWSVVRRNFHLVRRYLGWELVFLFYNVINTLTIALIAFALPPADRDRTIIYLTIGALLWNFLSILFQEVASSVSWERWEGTIEYSFMAPIHRLTYLAGVCMYAVLYGVLRTIVILVAVALFFHIHLARADWLGAAMILAGSSLPFIGLGLIGAVLPLLSTERGAQATQVIQGVILLVSGIYYPISVLPGWIRWMSHLSPATYTLEAARRAILNGEGPLHLLPLTIKLFLSGLILVPLGLAVFQLAEHWAMRNGTLKRSG